MTLDDEKEKAIFVYKLELRKLIVDRLLIGVIIVLIWFLTNIFLEKLRNSLAQERFLVNKQFEAITSIKASYEELTDYWQKYTVNVNKVKLPNNYKYEYNKRIDNFVTISNEWSLVLPRDFVDKLDYLLWIHSGIGYKGFEFFREIDLDKIANHKAFMFSIDEYFSANCREILGIEHIKNDNYFMLERLSFNEVSNIGAGAYYDNNFHRWLLNNQ